jgi:Recombination endonuclease VII
MLQRKDETRDDYLERRRAYYAANPEAREKSRAASRAWRAAHPEVARERCRTWRQVNPEKAYVANRRGKQKFKCAKYGLSTDDGNTLLEAQKYQCAICGVPEVVAPGNGSLHIDHDHATDHVRGLLCSNCNRGLGFFKDDPALLLEAARYLNRTTVPLKKAA